MTERLWTGETDTRDWQCSHCGYMIPAAPTTSPETDHQFCSDTCLEAFLDGDQSFAGQAGYKRFRTGIPVLDTLVPNGIPTNAAIACVGEPGTRRTELLTELAWRALQRDEPAIVIAARDSPLAVLEHFFTLGWNPIPALDTGRLCIVDCVSHQLTDRQATEDGFNAWNRFLSATAADAILTVAEPTDPQSIVETVTQVVDDLTETGIVLIDSLDALTIDGSDGAGRYPLLRDLREIVCTARFVPIFVGATRLHTDVFDGVIDMRLTENTVSGMRLTQLGIRRLTGAQFTPRWVTYESGGSDGLFAFDPTAETTAVYGPDPTSGP